MGQIPGKLAGGVREGKQMLANWPPYNPSSPAARMIPDFPQYDPTNGVADTTFGGYIPEGIPRAPRPETAGTDYAVGQMQRYGDTNSAGTLGGVTPKRKGR